MHQPSQKKGGAQDLRAFKLNLGSAVVTRLIRNAVGSCPPCQRRRGSPATPVLSVGAPSHGRGMIGLTPSGSRNASVASRGEFLGCWLSSLAPFHAAPLDLAMVCSRSAVRTRHHSQERPFNLKVARHWIPKLSRSEGMLIRLPSSSRCRRRHRSLDYPDGPLLSSVPIFSSLKSLHPVCSLVFPGIFSGGCFM